MSDEKEAEIKAKLSEALNAGYQVLENGGESNATVKLAINVMENSSLFNSGKGAVCNKEKKDMMQLNTTRMYRVLRPKRIKTEVFIFKWEVYSNY